MFRYSLQYYIHGIILTVLTSQSNVVSQRVEDHICKYGQKIHYNLVQSHTQSDSSGGSRICIFSTFHNDHVHVIFKKSNQQIYNLSGHQVLLNSWFRIRFATEEHSLW